MCPFPFEALRRKQTGTLLLCRPLTAPMTVSKVTSSAPLVFFQHWWPKSPSGRKLPFLNSAFLCFSLSTCLSPTRALKPGAINQESLQESAESRGQLGICLLTSHLYCCFVSTLTLALWTEGLNLSDFMSQKNIYSSALRASSEVFCGKGERGLGCFVELTSFILSRLLRTWGHRLELDWGSHSTNWLLHPNKNVTERFSMSLPRMCHFGMWITLTWSQSSLRRLRKSFLPTP